jgi:hypothetical protein
MNNLDKALQTNSSQNAPIDKKCVLDVSEFREPNFNQAIIQKRIDELDKEAKDLKLEYLIHGLGVLELEHLQVIDLELLALKENLKTEKLRDNML